MPNYNRTYIKDFNSALLHEQTAALPITGVTWFGFVQHPTLPERYTPGLVDPGLMEFTASRTLTAGEEAALDTTLTSHLATTNTAEQGRNIQDDLDIIQLRADFIAWDGMTTAQRFVVCKLMLRMLLREARGEAV